LKSGTPPRSFRLWRAGFGDALVYLIHLEGQKCAYDHFEWNNQTMHVAHEYIDMNWAKLEDGDVVDVQFILGETPEPKKSERETV